MLQQQPQHTGDSAFWALTAEECQCRAVRCSPLANLIESESRRLRAQDQDRCSPSCEVLCLQAEFLACRAVDIRNRAAQGALLAYFGLMEVHAQREILQQTRSEIQRLADTLDALREEDLPVALDPTELARRQLVSLEKGADLDVLERKLTYKLKELIGIDPESPQRIWTVYDLRPQTHAIDRLAAIELGLCHRADLGSERVLLKNLDESTLPLVNAALDKLQAGLGGIPDDDPCGTCGILKRLACRRNREDQTQVRCEQLWAAHRFSQQQARGEISEAVIDLERSLTEVALANERLLTWNDRIARLEAEQSARSVDLIELANAKFSRLAAKSELMHALMMHEAARVKLKSRQGLLATECGFRCREVCCLDQ